MPKLGLDSGELNSEIVLFSLHLSASLTMGRETSLIVFKSDMRR